MVYAVDPQTSPVYVTWGGHLTCPHPRLPQGPLPLAAPETVAAISIVTAANGGLASVMSARTGRGGSTVNGAVLAALAMPQAQEAVGPASAMVMGTHAVATVTTSAGSASARTTQREPTASFAHQATTGTPGLVAPVSGNVGDELSSPTCPQWLWVPAGLGDCCLQVVGLQGPGLACPIVCGLSQPLRCYSPVPQGLCVPHSPLPSPLTAAPLAR